MFKAWQEEVHDSGKYEGRLITPNLIRAAKDELKEFMEIYKKAERIAEEAEKSKK